MIVWTAGEHEPSPSPIADALTHAPVTLAHSDALIEVETFVTHFDVALSQHGKRFLAAMLQRIYQEGVLAGHDRAAAIVKGGR